MADVWDGRLIYGIYQKVNKQVPVGMVARFRYTLSGYRFFRSDCKSTSHDTTGKLSWNRRWLPTRTTAC